MINKKLKVSLGGLKQKIHIKSLDPNLPVLLFLHGGPGVTNRHSVMKTNDDLLPYFTLVAWDQRGTAGSYFGCKEDTLTINRLTEDANELVNYLCERFSKKKIFIIGGSWGSLLGTSLLSKYPEKIAAFVGFGQFVNGHLNELLSWQFCLEEATKVNDTQSIERLNLIGPPIKGIYKTGFDGMMEQRNIMMKYGGYSKNENKRSYWNAMVKPVLFSGEYSILDIIGYIKGYKFVLKKMWPEVGAVDFAKTHTRFSAPIYIFDGRLDKNTPSELVEDWYNQIIAPDKALYWFENSGHNPLFDETDKFKSLLKEKLLPIAKKEMI